MRRSSPQAPRRVLLAKPGGLLRRGDRACKAVELALDQIRAALYVAGRSCQHALGQLAGSSVARFLVTEVERCRPARRGCFRARHRPPRCRSTRNAAGCAHRRACPLVTKVHNEAQRFAAKDYDFLLGGPTLATRRSSHRGGGPVQSPLVDGPPGRRRRGQGPVKGGLAVADRPLSVDETIETVQRAARAFFPDRLDPPTTTSATPRRTARLRSSHRDQAETGHRRRLADSELGPAGRGGPRIRRAGPYLVGRRRRGRGGLARGSDHGRCHQRSFGAGGMVAAVLAKLLPSGSARWRKSKRSRSNMTFALPRELRTSRTAGSAQTA